MSKEEILSAIQSCAQKLGRVPTRRELQKMNGVSHREVDRRFGSYGRAVTLAGMEPERKHRYGIGREPLLEDWARVARWERFRRDLNTLPKDGSAQLHLSGTGNAGGR